MEDIFTPIFAELDKVDSNPRFNSKQTLNEYLSMYGSQIDSYNNYELYIIARNKGVCHEACQKWNKDIEKYWQ